MKNNCLFYKGYSARPELSREDGVFRGVLLGISDLVDFQSDTVKGLKKAFEEAVDDYLELCEEIGKEPEKEYSGCFNVRIDPKLHRDAALEAAHLGISMNRLTEIALSHFIRNNKFLVEKYKKEIEQSIWERLSASWSHLAASGVPYRGKSTLERCVPC